MAASRCPSTQFLSLNTLLTFIILGIFPLKHRILSLLFSKRCVSVLFTCYFTIHAQHPSHRLTLHQILEHPFVSGRSHHRTHSSPASDTPLRDRHIRPPVGTVHQLINPCLFSFSYLVEYSILSPQWIVVTTP